MKEALQGRRLGFALRPVFGLVAVGIIAAATFADFAAWFGWGARDSGGFVWIAYWLTAFGTILCLLALIATLAELRDVPRQERSLARIDLALLVVMTVALAASAVLRGMDLGVAAAGPAELLLVVLALLASLVSAVIGGTLYAPREWEEIVEDVQHDRRPRRRAAR